MDIFFGLQVDEPGWGGGLISRGLISGSLRYKENIRMLVPCAFIICVYFGSANSSNLQSTLRDIPKKRLRRRLH